MLAKLAELAELITHSAAIKRGHHKVTLITNLLRTTTLQPLSVRKRKIASKGKFCQVVSYGRLRVKTLLSLWLTGLLKSGLILHQNILFWATSPFVVSPRNLPWLPVCSFLLVSRPLIYISSIHNLTCDFLLHRACVIKVYVFPSPYAS